MLADHGGFWVDRHSERFAMGLKTEHRSGFCHSGAREHESGAGCATCFALFFCAAELAECLKEGIRAAKSLAIIELLRIDLLHLHAADTRQESTS